MRKTRGLLCVAGSLLLIVTVTGLSFTAFAANQEGNGATTTKTKVIAEKTPTPTLNYPSKMYLSLPRNMVPPIRVHAKSWILVDYNSGQVLTSGNPDERLSPASLTKVMSYYVVAEALRNGKIKESDKVRISRKAWKTGGSRMFVKAGDSVSVKDLLQGMVVQSGNDATVALAEYVAGSEDAFVVLMNRVAQRLGMLQTNFTNTTGLPHIKGKTTVRDLSILVRDLIKNYPKEYQLYSQKWFSWSGIKQPNRNRLLWHFEGADGVKTGYTKDAGYCLISSAQRDGMRLIAVVMGSKSERARVNESQKLLTYGFRFFENRLLYKKDQVIVTPKVWLSATEQVKLGLKENLYLAVPYGEAKDLTAALTITPYLKAPVLQGQSYGRLVISFKGKTILEKPLVALNGAEEGGMWTRVSGRVSLFFHQLFG
ncbi:D-alanyl-D-alanine carboxypeptidase DacC precursor [Piscirickettsia salmonis]|uniref:serine-type D-Ala-D-Ala carboxypeptidase n=1 Tax=Piscirickettsia salmonis TaxID=1238 RepID=A0A1L6TEN3_PISSA|nr:D-alanyl-D-alanine carboxypeptidase family protein [Piscirickettsia salmonis]AKP72574.1 D-alanyl-D-alanine carboxypeptidase [Piscirickettsia salmonis LF-89 = ATCC VR-1361]ALB23949.1 D-alanyl-D-alanine carboxypeptidase [Piscirickettsia salmonis]ALY03772.1 D-alanyl-D-alanine carboxypeptidase [Piscirickettsia salmonis]AMA43334.1 D-alanyl-D-alanine carboxypeptidase [Piscirickettsia salmonis]AOS35804.1 D-alanyl-D-alanine carboxypeptidase [Piscirickettsia salmonis]